jgi:hypothetical protein
MLDTVKLWLDKDSAYNVDLLAEIPCYLSNVTEHTKKDQDYITGYLKNLRVNINESGISVHGSIAKYFLNDNFNTLQRQDIQRAFEQIEDEIHLPIKESKVTRIDFAQNFITKYNPESYYNYLGQCQYFKDYYSLEAYIIQMRIEQSYFITR